MGGERRGANGLRRAVASVSNLPQDPVVRIRVGS